MLTREGDRQIHGAMVTCWWVGEGNWFWGNWRVHFIGGWAVCNDSRTAGSIGSSRSGSVVMPNKAACTTSCSCQRTWGWRDRRGRCSCNHQCCRNKRGAPLRARLWQQRLPLLAAHGLSRLWWMWATLLNAMAAPTMATTTSSGAGVSPAAVASYAHASAAAVTPEAIAVDATHSTAGGNNGVPTAISHGERCAKTHMCV